MIRLLDLILCGASLLLTFLIFVNVNKLNTKANLWFGAFVFCVFLLFLENILLYTELVKEDDFIFELISLSSFTVAPIFYLSVSYYVVPVKKLKLIECLHFGFAFIMLILIVLSHFIDEKVNAAEINSKKVDNATLVFYILFSLQVILYCLLALRKIVKHQKNISLLNSTVDNIDLNWLKHICISVSVVALFWFADIVFKLSEASSIFDSVSSAIYLIGVFYITFYWLKQKEIFPYNATEKLEIETIIAETANRDDSRKKLITDEKLEQLKQELVEIMSTKKPFLEDDLNLVKLATLLNVSSHQLSYIINKGFDENFYQFVNKHRIEEAKKLILDPKMEHLSLAGIGFEVGFNSKTVFNTTFKKIIGQTPSEFKKQNGQKSGS